MKLDDYLMRQAFRSRDWPAAIANLAQYYGLAIADPSNMAKDKDYSVSDVSGEEESISICLNGQYAVWSSTESYIGCVVLRRPILPPAIRIYCDETIRL
jgi:hypothetical protein